MEWLRELSSWFADNWTDIGNLIFAAVVAWTAYVGLKLNRRLAEAELDPAVTIYIEPDRVHWTFFELVIKNAGRGVARNIRFRVDPDRPVESDDPDSRLTRMAIFQRGINFMAPLQEFRTFYGTYVQLEKDPITIHVTYERESESRKRRTVNAVFVIDVTEYEGMSKIGDSPELEISRSLEKLVTDVHTISQGGSWWNPTVSVRRRYIFSDKVNRMWRRWFGSVYLNSEDSPWTNFKKELRRTLRELWQSKKRR